MDHRSRSCFGEPGEIKLEQASATTSSDLNALLNNLADSTDFEKEYADGLKASLALLKEASTNIVRGFEQETFAKLRKHCRSCAINLENIPVGIPNFSHLAVRSLRQQS